MTELFKPRAAVLKTTGTNDHENMNFGLEQAGAEAEIVHMNELLEGVKNLENYELMAIPGGFSRGDAIAAGRVWSLEFKNEIGDQLNEFLEKKKVIFGVCNGFQVLVQMGLLPFGSMQDLDENKTSLTINNSQKFSSQWVHLRPENKLHVSNGEQITLPIGHGEGKFVAEEDVLQQIEERGLVAWRYCTAAGDPTQEYPENPNGSSNAIAGLIDPKGRIIGLMPHPDRYLYKENYPNWRREDMGEPHGTRLLRQIVDFAR